MPTFIITGNNRVCAFSYKNEKDLPDGQKLLTCSGCQETHYVSREAQSQHLKYHQQVCRKAEDEELQPLDFHGVPLASLLDNVCYLLENPDQIKGRKFLYLLQAVLGQLKGIHGSISEDEAHAANRVKLALLVTLSGFNREGAAAANEEVVLQKIWSIPGFASYFLSDDILMSETMKEWKCKGLPPPEPQTYDPSMQVNTVYCELVADLFFGTVRTVNQRQEGEHQRQEEEPHTRVRSNSALSVAVVRQIGRTWRCPYSRASQPSFKKRSLFLTAMMDDSFAQAHSPARKFMTEQEVFPGMNMKQILHVLMDDERFFRDPSDISTRAILRSLSLYCRSIHYKEHLTPLDRIELLDKFFEWDVPKKFFVLQLDDGVAWPTGIRQVMYMLCTSFSTNTFLKIRAEILKTPDPKSVMTADSSKKKYHFLMDEVMPLVELYVNLVEPAYQRRAESSNDIALPFPSELILYIGEYVLPSNNYATCCDSSTLKKSN